jgi:hypothetical protein
VNQTATAEQVKKQEERSKKKLQREQDDLRWILSDPRGRRFIWKWLNKAMTFETGFMGNSRDVYEWGKQFIGKSLQKEIMDVSGFKSLDQMYREDKALKEQEEEN